MTGLLGLLWANRRLVAVVMVAIFALAALGWFGHSRYAAGEAAGRAHVQKAWDAAAEAQRAAYEAAAANAAKTEADQRRAAEEIENGLREQIQTADAGARDLARRLRDWQARARGCALPGTAPTAGQPDRPGGSADNDATVERLVEDTYAACSRDAARLDAWQKWAADVGLIR